MRDRLRTTEGRIGKSHYVTPENNSSAKDKNWHVHGEWEHIRSKVNGEKVFSQSNWSAFSGLQRRKCLELPCMSSVSLFLKKVSIKNPKISLSASPPLLVIHYRIYIKPHSLHFLSYCF